MRSARRSDTGAGPVDLGALLARARTIALVGASPERWRPCLGIMRYLQGAGYRVVPVNPNHAGKTLNGERVVSSLLEAGAGVDLANVFRRPDALDAVVDEVLKAGIPALWTQLGIVNPAATQRAEAAGVIVVANRCISVEHMRLMARADFA